MRILHYDDVSGILTLGGTILGTSKTANPYRYAVKKGEQIEIPRFVEGGDSKHKETGSNLPGMYWGDGTLGIAYRLFQDGVSYCWLCRKQSTNDLRGRIPHLGSTLLYLLLRKALTGYTPLRNLIIES